MLSVKAAEGRGLAPSLQITCPFACIQDLRCILVPFLNERSSSILKRSILNLTHFTEVTSIALVCYPSTRNSDESVYGWPQNTVLSVTCSLRAGGGGRCSAYSFEGKRMCLLVCVEFSFCSTHYWDFRERFIISRKMWHKCAMYF